MLDFFKALFRDSPGVEVAKAENTDTVLKASTFRIIEFEDGSVIIRYLNAKREKQSFVWGMEMDYHYENAQRFKTKESAVHHVEVLCKRHSIKSSFLI